MPQTIEGSLNGASLKIAIIVARFNEIVTKKLLEGALDGLSRHGVNIGSDVHVIWVPGAYEIPVVAKAVGKSGKYDAVICIGAVIRGATAHFDFVAGGAASGIMSAQMDTLVPCIFGVLTTDTMEQCFDRAGGKSGNKGYEAAVTAIEQVNLLKFEEQQVLLLFWFFYGLDDEVDREDLIKFHHFEIDSLKLQLLDHWLHPDAE